MRHDKEKPPSNSGPRRYLNLGIENTATVGTFS